MFDAFVSAWTSPAVDEAWSFFDALRARQPSAQELLALLEPGSREYSMFDRIGCQYEQAGTLIKYGAMHPKLFLAEWRDPESLWAFAGPWVLATRKSINAPYLYENFEWLARFACAQGPRAKRPQAR